MSPGYEYDSEYGGGSYNPDNCGEVSIPPEIAPVIETPENEYTGGYELLGKNIANGPGIDLNSLASGAVDVTSSVVSGAVDIASSIVSGTISVASELASGAVKLTTEAATARKSGDLNKYSKGYTYEHDGFYTEEDSNPFASDTGVDLNEYNSGYTNEEIRNSLGCSEGEDLNQYSKASKDAESEQSDSALDNFQEDRWNDLSLEEQKQSMTDLAGYVAAETGNKNPPDIVFRDDMNDGEYGGYNPGTNTLEINQNMLGDSAEAADTVAHEMWHAHQQQCASDPSNDRGREYQEAFDNYISPEYDFEGYQNQMVEAEAREFAQGFKDRLAGMKGSV